MKRLLRCRYNIIEDKKFRNPEAASSLVPQSCRTTIVNPQFMKYEFNISIYFVKNRKFSNIILQYFKLDSRDKITHDLQRI